MEPNELPTSIELWGDPQFLQSRIREQIEYIIATGNSDKPHGRKLELVLSAMQVMGKFSDRLLTVMILIPNGLK